MSDSATGQSLFRCCPFHPLCLSLPPLFSFSSAARVHSCSEYRHYRSVKIISSANLQLGKTRKLWKIQRCWQPPSLRGFLSISISVPLSHLSARSLFIAPFFIFILVFFFLIFHLLLLSPALAFIHRANYALQCVAVAIVPPAQTPQLFGVVYILYIYMYVLYSVFYTWHSLLRSPHE